MKSDIKKIGVISDTHIPIVSDDLPQKAYEYLDSCDLIIHAGDFVSEQFYNKLRSKYKLIGVQGNMDEPYLKKNLPEREIVKAGSLLIGVIHGRGAPSGLLDWAGKIFQDVNPQIIIFGHSHASLIKKVKDTLFLNPGSPTDYIYTDVNTMGIIEIEGDKFNAQIVEF